MSGKHYCICDTPKPKTQYDDRGQKVVYCDRCWKPIRKIESKNNDTK